MKYADQDLPMLVDGVSGEVSLKAWAHIKVILKARGVLHPLWCESELSTFLPLPCGIQEFGDTIVKPLQTGRLMANKLVPVPITGEAVKACLARQSRNIRLADNFFQVEANYFALMLGAKGAEVLHDRALSLFPTETVGKDRVALTAALEELMQSSLYNFATEVARMEVKEALAVVKALASGQAPRLVANPTTATHMFISFVL